MCERGATTDELADALGVSVDVISLWQRVQPEFFEACKLTPTCIERFKRSIFESAVGKIVGLEKTVVFGSQVQTTKSRADMPANFGAAKFFTSQKEFQVEGEMAAFLRVCFQVRCWIPRKKLKLNKETRAQNKRKSPNLVSEVGTGYSSQSKRGQRMRY